ncbi:MAG: (2Fe-2S)-binding protein [Chloroflexi bacterium]|nr:(2Fe-2S)-binding protein [Chloroflexota bacterium]
MKTVSLSINGQKISATQGESLLWVALDRGIYIPNLCSLRGKGEPMAACRLCFVEIDGYRQPVTACTIPVGEGVAVNTRSPEALRLARSGFELLMASHPVECATCAVNGSCELQRIARHLGMKLRSKRLRKLLRGLPIDSSHPSFVYDPNKCVLCGRCVWVCRKQGNSLLGFAHRGFERIVTTFGDEPIGNRCQECGECVRVCPSGAFVFKERSQPVAAG